MTQKKRLLGLLSLILIAGFFCTSVASYWVSRDSIVRGILVQELPLTGDNIYSELQKDILRPVFISSLMAHDTFLRDWILRGEKDAREIQRYLEMVKNRYDTITSFLVSERSRNYYFPGGILKKVKEDEPLDTWFFRMRKMSDPYETNVDPDMANRNTMTVFINYRVLDYDNRFIGVTGVGLTFDTLRRIIDNYQERFMRRIYFVDRQGMIVLAGRSMKDIHGSIHNIPGLKDVAAKLLNTDSKPKQLEYRSEEGIILLNSRFIPELGWYLVVEQNEELALQPVRRVFWMNLTVSTAATMLILLITLFAVNRFQMRLERMATTDHLTGLYNRQGLEVLFDQMLKEVDRSGVALSAILMDIDHFKSINDRYGHLVGDRVIQDMAKRIHESLRKSDVLARWGGEEYLVLLKDCELVQALEISEKIRKGFLENPLQIAGMSGPITVSLGVARLQPGEVKDKLLARADQALYRAKEKGRNRSEVAA
ncbi:MAG: GGDEF domain-containing protein [Nitrospirae bacterium]|nr:MAG: GGDEF domain-containing protein [Nitrospirota bacterium]